MPVIDISKAETHECPFRDWRPCRGDACMAWTWHGPAFDHAETDNVQDTADGPRPVGVPPLPDERGGWEADGAPFSRGYHRSGKDKLPAATGQRWVRPREVRMGFCGRCGPPDANGYPF